MAKEKKEFTIEEVREFAKTPIGDILKEEALMKYMNKAENYKDMDVKMGLQVLVELFNTGAIKPKYKTITTYKWVIPKKDEN